MKEQAAMVRAWLAELEDQIKRHKEMYDQCVGTLYKGVLADQIEELITLRDELNKLCAALDIKGAA
jgi:uncharacterized coiled-coil DUF342 family protein